MKNFSRYLKAALTALGMFVLILDTKTALQGAADGLELSIRTVVPSLFPFFMLSGLLTGSLYGTRLSFLRPIGRLCRIPSGAESLLAVGILGGYPVGAQCVTQAYRAGQLDEQTAKRMLGFCSNPGPAFLFGMAGYLFSNKLYPWLLFFIQVISALSVGILLPGIVHKTRFTIAQDGPTLSRVMQNTLRAMANVCGWIILFRVLNNILDRWLLWLLPSQWKVLFIGICELSNGMIALSEIGSEALRFVICALMLSFGGLCVTMQTVSATEGLGLGAYLPGKILQSIFSLLLSWMTVLLLREKISYILYPLSLYTAIFVCLWRSRTKAEKNSSISLAVGV